MQQACQYKSTGSYSLSLGTLYSKIFTPFIAA